MDRNLILTLSEWLGAIAVVMLLQLGARLQPKAVGFRYQRREGWISLSLFVVMLLASLALNSFGVLTTLTSTLGELGSRLILAAVGLILLGLLMAIRGQPLRSIGWDPARMGMGLRLGLALVFLTVFLRGKFNGIVNGLSPVEANGLFIWLAVALVEETLFRGYIQLRLCDWLGPRWGWVLTAFLFTLFQVQMHGSLMTVGTLGLVLTACQALVLGWLAQRSGSTLAVWLYRATSEWLWMVV